MGLFSRKSEPIFIKEDSSAEEQLSELRQLLYSADKSNRITISKDIALTEARIAGEKRVAFELKNSHLPLFVLHDLYLEHDGSTAQIDFLVITPFVNLTIECKNLVGDIEINSKGDFIRSFYYGKHRKEGIDSPIAQNLRHLALIKQICIADTKNVAAQWATEKYSESSYQGIVVLANPRTVLTSRYAKQDIKNQIIRADALVEHIKALISESENDGNTRSSDAEMKEFAQYFLSKHVLRNENR